MYAQYSCLQIHSKEKSLLKPFRIANEEWHTTDYLESWYKPLHSSNILACADKLAVKGGWELLLISIGMNKKSGLAQGLPG